MFDKPQARSARIRKDAAWTDAGINQELTRGNWESPGKYYACSYIILLNATICRHNTDNIIIVTLVPDM